MATVSSNCKDEGDNNRLIQQSADSDVDSEIAAEYEAVLANEPINTNNNTSSTIMTTAHDHHPTEENGGFTIRFSSIRDNKSSHQHQEDEMVRPTTKNHNLNKKRNVMHGITSISKFRFSTTHPGMMSTALLTRKGLRKRDKNRASCNSREATDQQGRGTSGTVFSSQSHFVARATHKGLRRLSCLSRMRDLPTSNNLRRSPRPTSPPQESDKGLSRFRDLSHDQMRDHLHHLALQHDSGHQHNKETNMASRLQQPEDHDDNLSRVEESDKGLRRFRDLSHDQMRDHLHHLALQDAFGYQCNKEPRRSPRPTSPPQESDKGLSRFRDLSHDQMRDRLHHLSPQDDSGCQRNLETSRASRLWQPEDHVNNLSRVSDSQHEEQQHEHNDNDLSVSTSNVSAAASLVISTSTSASDIVPGAIFVHHDPEQGGVNSTYVNGHFSPRGEESSNHSIVIVMPRSASPTHEETSIAREDGMTSSHVSHPSSDEHSPSSEGALVHAVPVEPIEDVVVGEAELVDPAELERERIKLQKAKECRRCGMGVIIIAITTLVLAIVLGEKEPHTVIATMPTSANVTTTIAPSTLPTETPSSISISPPPDFLTSLSNSTKEMVFNKPTSPQGNALEWVMSYPNFYQLETWRQLQLFALATFFFSFHGLEWAMPIRDDWMVTTKSECLWYSLQFVLSDYYAARDKYDYIPKGAVNDINNNKTICNSLGQYEYLELTGVNGIHGEVPPEIEHLSALRGLAIRSSHLTEDLSSLIPSELLLLSDLKSIDFLWNKEVHGTIPTLLGNMTALEDFAISRNRISGVIPSAIGLASRLRRLFMEENDLEGPIPSEIDGLPRLTDVYLSHNLLNGSIPIFRDSSHIAFLYLTHNLLTGTIYQDLTSKSSLRRLGLGNNFLSGTLPVIFSSSLEMLDLSSNRLTGSLPAGLGAMSQLTSLYLHENAINSSIPEELYDLSSLKWVNLHGNALSGTLSSRVGLLSNLEWLILNSNRITGPIPSEISTLPYLEQFVAFSNSFTGTIPEDMWRLRHLIRVDLEDNTWLSGSISSTIGLATNLTMLYFGGNQLEGSLPSEIFSLTSLESLSLGRNRFTEQLMPTEFGQLADLNFHLFLQEAGFLGPIPSELGLLSSLKWLNIGGNALNSTIPSEVGNLKAVRVLDLQNNTITGHLPTELGNLQKIKKLYLNGNHALNGTVPSELGRLTSLQGLSLDHTSLSGSVPWHICLLPSLRLLRANCSLLKCECNVCDCA
jgi:Leucine-rich repeat (LRR) protein